MIIFQKNQESKKNAKKEKSKKVKKIKKLKKVKISKSKLQVKVSGKKKTISGQDEKPEIKKLKNNLQKKKFII